MCYLPERFCFEPVLTGKKETRKAWYVYAASGVGSVVFLLIVASLMVLLWRRRRSSEKHSEIPGTAETEMTTMVTSPKRTQVKCDYSLVSEGSKAPPTVVWYKSSICYWRSRKVENVGMWLACGTREIRKTLMERISAKNYIMPTSRRLAKTSVWEVMEWPRNFECENLRPAIISQCNILSC